MLSSVDFGDTHVIADLEAGIGTLTRLADDQLDAVLLVVEPTAKSIEVGVRAARLVREKSLGHLVVVASRVCDDADRAALVAALGDAEIVVVPQDDEILAADRRGLAPLDVAPDAPAVRALAAMAESLVVRARR